LNQAYVELERRFAALDALKGAQAVLSWDREVMMPGGAAASRAEQLAALGQVCHARIADPELADLLDAAEQDTAKLDDWQAANLAHMRRTWRHETALDARLVEALSRAQSRSIEAWSSARPAADFSAFLPAFQEIVVLSREAAAAKAAALGKAPWDALLDAYEDSLTGEQIDALFDRLATALPPIRDRAMAAQAARPAPLQPKGPFPAERQKNLGERLMALAGFDFGHGRLDTSAHPFTGGVFGDVRITTRFDEHDFTSSVMAVMHETGHALYEQGRPADWAAQPVGEAANMTMHESQSLLVEMQAARSPQFLAFAAPIIAQELGGQGPAFRADNLHALATRVAPGCIRVDADELHYPFHIVLRTRLERALIAGDLAPADLPGAWNEAMAELVGVTPPDDRLGCLQDIHWPIGAFGYFPTYTLGALAAAQLFAAATAQDGDILPGLERGDFAPLLTWLRHNIHRHGARQSTQELLIAATGAPLSTQAFEAHLARRYLD
jgi:carboxypeptidase Taq